MLIQIVWILTIAATGTCSTSCQSSKIVDICSLDPEIGDGQSNIQEWFYDKRTDRCLLTKFDSKEDPEGNRFTFEEYCVSECRKNVPKYCFDDANNYPTYYRQTPALKWTYDSDAIKCVQFTWKGKDTTNKNVFNSQREYETKCKDRDIGPCKHRIHFNCKHGDDLYYSFDYQKKECRTLNGNECPAGGNAFYSLRDCYQRCGRVVENVCKLPIQNMSFCSTFERRYGYNTNTQRCEEFRGCPDIGNNFDSAKKCWDTCAENKNPCVMQPDYKVRFIFTTRYYYDINTHNCVEISLFRGKVTGTTNLFETSHDCKKACMATYVPEPDW
uniref:Putative salivary kunitz domain protein n=1 Tax=Ixodes ricinus TaxID=34613 RepID=A0A0K8R6N1_IXORI